MPGARGINLPALTGDEGSRQLPNPRHEAFARLYAGEHWGNASQAYRAAGYSARGVASVASCANELLHRVDVRARVAYWRQRALDRLGIDVKAILERRLRIIDAPDVSAADRLAGLRDIERGLGLLPDREHGGAQVAVAISIDGLLAEIYERKRQLQKVGAGPGG